MASLIRRSNGIFYVVFFCKGRQVWKSTHTRSLEQAKEEFEELKREWEKKNKSTFSSFVSKFLEQAPLSYSLKTIETYQQSFANFIRIIGDKRLAHLSPLDAEEFKRVRSAEVSPVSVNIELRTLKAAFNVAVQWKLIPENPFQNIKQVRVPYNEPHHLSRTQFDVLLGVVKEQLLRDVFRFAVFTMMRISEIVNLRWANVDLESRWIDIRSNGEFRVKGGKPRSVPISNEVYSLLVSKSRLGEYVFTDAEGRKLNPSTVSHSFRKAVRKAGLPDSIHFHSLRHTGISWLINRGVPAPFVQRIAGHSSLAVTQIYTHLEDENLHTAISAFGGITTN